MKKLFVGKLAFSTTEDALRAHLSSFQTVSSVKLITDKFSGASRGFAFVTIDDDQEADSAISTLDGSSLDGRKIVINEARPQTERAPRSFAPNYRNDGADTNFNR
jgi:cold-inducible RNA-binding protein